MKIHEYFPRKPFLKVGWDAAYTENKIYAGGGEGEPPRKFKYLR
jgi:hypothetical protein